jgi:hypothetical protein
MPPGDVAMLLPLVRSLLLLLLLLLAWAPAPGAVPAAALATSSAPWRM